MAVPSLSGIVAIGVDILNAVRDAVTKTVLFQTGDVVTGQVESDRVESWQHAGFCSMPGNPLPGQAACQGIVWKRGDIDVCTNTRDLRGQEIAGALGAGETCVYAAGADGTGQARSMWKTNGSINHYTRVGNTANGAGMGIFINPADDSISIVNGAGNGILIKTDGIYITSTGSALKLLTSGECSLVGSGTCQVDGTSVTIGSRVLPGVNSAITGVTGVAGKASLKVFIE